jgi:asparagine synthase (glutamine-hydrolysing)
MSENDIIADTSAVAHTGLNLQAQLKESLTNNVLPAILRYEDRNSMAHSVESRVPFLTTELVDAVRSFPAAHLINDNGVSKAVLRRAIKSFVPASIRDRRDKIGFVAPFHGLIDCFDSTALERLDAAEIIEPSMLRKLISAEGHTAPQNEKLSWRISMLAAWADIHDIDLAAP